MSKGQQYHWEFFAVQGVGRFVRVSDGVVGDFETGTEAAELNARIARMTPDEIDALGAADTTIRLGA